MERRTAENAPKDTPILVWVRNASDDRKSGAWKMGKLLHGYGLPDELHADGFSGPWDIPFWSPLPENPE